MLGPAFRGLLLAFALRLARIIHRQLARSANSSPQTIHATRIFRFALKIFLNVSRNSCQTPARTIGNHMYLSFGNAAKEAGVAKSTISKALSSGKLSHREKNSDG
jgi:hypothetical protein